MKEFFLGSSLVLDYPSLAKEKVDSFMLGFLIYFGTLTGLETPGLIINFDNQNNFWYYFLESLKQNKIVTQIGRFFTEIEIASYFIKGREQKKSQKGCRRATVMILSPDL